VIDTILLIIAAVCFALVALKIDPIPRLSLLGVGLCAWVLTGLL
jgi:hypothetical protein